MKRNVALLLVFATGLVLAEEGIPFSIVCGGDRIAVKAITGEC